MLVCKLADPDTAVSKLKTVEVEISKPSRNEFWINNYLGIGVDNGEMATNTHTLPPPPRQRHPPRNRRAEISQKI